MSGNVEWVTIMLLVALTALSFYELGGAVGSANEHKVMHKRIRELEAERDEARRQFDLLNAYVVNGTKPQESAG